MRRFFPFLASFAIALAPLAAAPAPARAADCQFVLGFLTLQQMIPSEIGSCVTDVEYNPSTGDALQMTTGPTGFGGLLVWRKADNFTAFTDGYRTWINGPFGLQMRLNSQRFFWERNQEGLPIVPTPAPGDRCHTAGLSASLEEVDAGAGNFFATFRLTNELDVPCTLFGFVGAQMLDAQNNPLPTNVVRNGGQLSNQPGPTLFTVGARESATFLMHWEDVPVGGETSCPTSSQLEVTPPDEFDSLVIPVQITACNRGQLDVAPVRPGG
jgi:hypothetical protein